MYWNSVADFLAMGGYAPYVWWSFGLTAAFMLLEPLLIRRQRQSLLARLRRLYRAEQRAGGRHAGPLSAE